MKTGKIGLSTRISFFSLMFFLHPEFDSNKHKKCPLKSVTCLISTKSHDERGYVYEK